MMKHIYMAGLLAGGMLAMNACPSMAGGKKKEKVRTVLVEQEISETDPLASHVDKSVRAQDDFFDFANGAWFKAHPIPASEQDNGIFQLLEDTIQDQVRRICQTSAAQRDAPKGSNVQKIGDLYYSGMDSVARNQQGLQALDAYLKDIDAVSSLEGLAQEVAKLYRIGCAPIFTCYVSQDDHNSEQYIVQMMQGGLSMPDRTYYVDKDESARTARVKFVDYAQKIFQRLGYAEADARLAGEKQLALETALARISRKTEDLRDPFQNYHKQSVEEFEKLAPSFAWKAYFKGMGLEKADSVNVGQPEFYTALEELWKNEPLSVWKDYLKFQLADQLTSYADDETYAASFEFYNQTLSGVTEQRPRWKRVVSTVNDMLGDLVGQVYVEEYLPKGTKEKLQEIGRAIREQFAERIRHLDWMSQTTKEKALHKLNAIEMKLGYPDKWKDLSSVEISRKSYLENVLRLNEWYFNYEYGKYGKPVDRTEWDMEPQTYNAYYNPSNNEIVIPGCNILVPGYEKTMADDAILYAIVGGTFGHELTHGFDDQGCKYDEIGNLQNWWTADDKAQFDARTKKIVEQFNAYETVKGLHINGENTQGENIADLGGIIAAYNAFKQTAQYKEGKKIAGYTPSQRFFLGYALAWMQNQRPEAMATQVKSNEHSPAKWRVLGPLSNMPEFYEAFGVKPGDKMYRSESERVRIW